MAAGPQLPDWQAEQYAAAADMAGVGTSEVIEVSQEQVKRAMPKFDPTLYTQKPPDEEEVAHPHPHPNPIPNPKPNPIPTPNPIPNRSRSRSRSRGPSPSPSP